MLWTILAGILVVGYVSLGKPFAYLGIPSAHLFIGELVLVIALLCRPRLVVDRFYLGLTQHTPFGAIAWSYLAFLSLGAVQVIHGVYQGFPLLTALESFAFHIYPLYLFLGLFAGTVAPNFLRTVILWLGWWNCFYGLAFIFFLNRIHLLLPGTSVPVFWGVGGGSLVIIGLLSFEHRLVRSLIPFVVNAFLVLAVQVRAEWLSLSLGLCLWGLLSRRMGRVALGFAAFSTLLAAGYAFDFNVPSSAGRGGSISFNDIVGRAVASVDADAAREFSTSAGAFAGTVKWRTAWWDAIWRSVHDDTSTTLIGHGYGYPLAALVPFLKNMELRTPHNVFFYALGYGGWLAVFVFFTFQAAVGYALWRTYVRTGQPFGIVLWVIGLTTSFFGNVFETPFGAIPIYLLLGAAMAPCEAVTEVPDGNEVRNDSPGRAQLLSAAWR